MTNKEHVPHKGSEIEKGFYVELPLCGKNPQYQLVSVTRWTDCPSIGVNAEIMNVLHSLRMYFRQAGRTKKTVKKIMQLVKSVYAENPAYFEKEDQFQEPVEEKEPALKNVRGNMKGVMTY